MLRFQATCLVPSLQISIIPIIIIIKVIKRHSAATRPVLSLRLLDKEVHTAFVCFFFVWKLRNHE